LLVDVLRFNPELVSFQRHFKDFISQANVVVDLGLSFSQASSQTLFKRADSTAKITLINGIIMLHHFLQVSLIDLIRLRLLLLLRVGKVKLLLSRCNCSRGYIELRCQILFQLFLFNFLLSSQKVLDFALDSFNNTLAIDEENTRVRWTVDKFSL